MRRIAESVRRGERGYTLPEVLTVIAILGILIAIAIIIWLGILERRRVDAAAKQLAADLRLAHASATNQLTDWRVVVTEPGTASPTGGCDADYCLVKLAVTYGPGSPPPVVMEVVPRDLPKGTKVLTSATTVPVDPGGAGTVLPSVAASTRTVEFNSDGTSRALAAPQAGVFVSSIDEDPRRKVSFRNTTSRIKITE